jgi:hypothetical protein
MFLTRYSGLASFPDGSVAADNFVATSDYVKGSGPYLLYSNITLIDGSILWLKNS